MRIAIYTEQSLLENDQPLLRGSAVHPGRLGALLFALLLILLSLSLPISRSPLPWVDEVLWTSAANNFHSHTGAIPNVLADFPGTGRFDLFYGPASLGLASVWLSVQPLGMQWNRALSLIAAVLLCALGGGIVWTCTRRIEAALGTAGLLGISMMIGSRATSGRLDALTIAAEFAAIYIVLRSDSPGRMLKPGIWCAAGLCLAFAVMSTPRALPNVAAIVGAVLFSLRPFKSAVMKAALTVGVIAVAVSAWTLSQGLTPLQWLRLIFAGSRGDAHNSSPLLGGSWGIISGGLLYSGVVFFFAALVFAVIALNLREAMRQWRTALLVTAAAVNVALTLALIARPASYDIYWMCLPVIAACAGFGGGVSGARKRLALAALIAVSFGWTCLRVFKDAQIISSWSSSDPQPASDFMAAHVPAGSNVYGPPDFFYYAVVLAGSRYLYPEEWTTPALDSHRAPVATGLGNPRFLIWPDGRKLPERFKQVTPVAHFPGAGANHRSRFNMELGYPGSTLYQVR